MRRQSSSIIGLSGGRAMTGTGTNPSEIRDAVSLFKAFMGFRLASADCRLNTCDAEHL